MNGMSSPAPLETEIARCRLCADRFRNTATAHAPRPVPWFGPGARILIAGQAPGARVHASGKPFDDPSGDRLRAWMGIGRDLFYDRALIAVLPMAFCFPGYDGKGSDLPPPKLCSETWHTRARARIGQVPLTLLVGSYAQRYHLPRAVTRDGVTATVRGWRAHAPMVLPLPHPSWRNTAWLKKNAWFEAELLPVLRAQVSRVLRPTRLDA